MRGALGGSRFLLYSSSSGVAGPVFSRSELPEVAAGRSIDAASFDHHSEWQ